MIDSDVARPIKKNPKGNLIKWWNVNIVEKEEVIDDSENVSSEINDETMIPDDVDVSDATESSSGSDEDAEYLKQAQEIYERLMREANEDEMKKQNEIEAAKLANEN